MSSKHDNRAHDSAIAGLFKNGAIWVKVGSNIQCDTSAGEKYIKESPGKLSSIEECQILCKDSADCQSITYLNTGWCSHFSTPCTNRKRKGKAVSMRLDTLITANFDDTNDFEGWNCGKITTCGKFGNICGGYDVKTGGADIQQTFMLPAGRTYLVTMDFIKIDSWFA